MGVFWGASLLAPQFVWADAAVLPKGIFRARVVNVITQGIDTKFNSEGEAEGILHGLNRSLDTQTMAASSADLAKIVQLANEIDPNYAQDFIQADLFAGASIYGQRYVPALEYGITEKLSLGMKIPIAYVNVKADFDVEVQNNLAHYRQMTQGMDAIEQGAWSKFEAGMPTPQSISSSILTSKGYEVPSDFSFGGLGDIEIGGRYQFYKNDWIMASVESGFRLPTAQNPKRQNNLLYTGTGDRNLDLGNKLLVDILPAPNTTLELTQTYEFQFADSYNWSVAPKGYTGGLVDLNNPAYQDTVSRNLGDFMESEVMLTQKMFNSTFHVGGGYNFARQNVSSYSGSKDLDYASLGANSEYSAHKMILKTGYSTIPLFAKKEFPVPAELNFQYHKTLGGVNTTDVSYVRADVIIYLK